MEEIKVFNRKTKEVEIEKVYKENFLKFLYCSKSSIFSKICLFLVSKIFFFSKFYGFLQKRKFSKKKIFSFIEEFKIDESEFSKKKEEFVSFYDFFIRKLKKGKREISFKENEVIFPSDGRYLVFPNIKEEDGFYVKQKKFDLRNFLKSDSLFKKYEEGSMAICRLAPSDYHRFHFPVDCISEKPILINGFLYSVNPIAIRKNIEIFCENKRCITLLKSKIFKDILFIEIGATFVGEIFQTSKEGVHKKRDEKGYFGLGGSSIVLLFEKDTILFEKDLILNSKNKIETKCDMGDLLGRSV